jgi:hypothetical protein
MGLTSNCAGAEAAPPATHGLTLILLQVDAGDSVAPPLSVKAKSGKGVRCPLACYMVECHWPVDEQGYPMLSTDDALKNNPGLRSHVEAMRRSYTEITKQPSDKLNT